MSITSQIMKKTKVLLELKTNLVPFPSLFAQQVNKNNNNNKY